MRRLLIPALFLLAAAGDPSSVDIGHPWARATPGTAKNGVMFVTFTDRGQPDRVVGVSTPAAEHAELHETIDDNGIMKMRPVDGIPLEPNAAVTLAPGGKHIMLMGLKAPLKLGDTFPVTFSFAHAAPVTVTVAVEPPGGGGMPDMHGH